MQQNNQTAPVKDQKVDLAPETLNRILSPYGVNIGLSNDPRHAGLWEWFEKSSGDCQSGYSMATVAYVSAVQHLGEDLPMPDENGEFDLSDVQSVFAGAEEESEAEKDVLSISTVIQNISDVLCAADGKYIVGIYNQICSDQIAYVGDGLFERLPSND